ncbi:hypothetical protein V498_02203 [Pseudogymnoascus sp. VKM F-4517 (FW-2822)]|nr:hypothetical protein V498_02203 [Pseudogymnoascus sp. VKM F-4517 (FW-2822)]
MWKSTDQSLTLANLRHSGTPTSAPLHAAESTLEACHHHRADEAGEEEPEESTAGLQLAAVLGGGAVVAENRPAFEVTLWAVSYIWFRAGGDDTCDEGEEGSEGVEDEQNEGDGDGFDESGGHAEEPDDPAEGDSEHGIVGGWAVGSLSGENVTDEGCEEENPEELEGAEGDLNDAHGGGLGSILISGDLGAGGVETRVWTAAGTLGYEDVLFWWKIRGSA